jgi:RNA-binding protein
MLTSKQRANLRSYANSPLINRYTIGKDILKPSVFESLDKALTANELIKVSTLENVDEEIREVADKLASELKAEVVQVIGRTAVLYRQNPKLKDKTRYKL